MNSSVCFLALGILLIEVLVFKRDIFSPFRLYLFSHTITLGIALLGLNKAMTPFHWMTNAVYFGSGTCFLLGTLVPNLMQYTIPKENRVLQPAHDHYNWKLHIYLSLPVFLVFIAGMGIAFYGTGQLPVLAEKKVTAISKFYTYSLVSFAMINCGYLAFFLFIMVALSNRADKIKFWVGSSIGILPIVVFTLAMIRNGIMAGLFLSILFYHYAVKKISNLRLAGITTVIIVLILISSYFKFTEFTGKLEGKIDNKKLIEIGLQIPYDYVANNYWNLNYALNPENFQERHPHTFGFSLLSSFFEFFFSGNGSWSYELRSSMDFESNAHLKSIKMDAYTTIGYQWNLFKDFGFIGTLIIPFIFGNICGFSYLKVKYSPTILNACLYACLAFNILFSFGGIVWVEIVYQLYGFFALMFIVYICRSRRFLEWPVHFHELSGNGA